MSYYRNVLIIIVLLVANATEVTQSAFQVSVRSILQLITISRTLEKLLKFFNNTTTQAFKVLNFALNLIDFDFLVLLLDVF